MLRSSARLSAVVLCALIGLVVTGFAAQVVQAKSRVVFWSNHRTEDEPAFREIVSRFEANHPDVEIEWANQPDSPEVPYYDKLIAAIAGGVAPDVFYVRPGTDFRFANNGWTYDIDPFVRRDAARLKIEDFLPPQMGELKYKGKWWAMPFDFSAIGLYYNQDMFDAAGLPYPTPGSTWADIREAALKMTRRSDGRRTQWGLHGLSWYFSQWAEGFMMSFGGRLFDETYTRAAANTPETVAALAFPQQLAHASQVAAPFNASNYGNLFFSGQAAMTLDGSWATTTHRLRNQFRFDVSSLPKGPAGLVVSATGGGWAMWAGTKAPQAAWEFMKELASPESSRLLVVKPVRSLPPRISLMQEWAKQITQAGQPNHALALGQQVIEHGKAIPLVPFSFQGVIGRYRDPLIYGQMSPQEAAVRIHEELNAEFRRLQEETP